jgi:hypothetical protein
LIRPLTAVAPGQLATLWGATVLVAVGLLWFAGTAGSRNERDERSFEAQVDESRATVQNYTSLVRAYTDSATQLSRITHGLRQAGERGFAVQANDEMIHTYQDLRRSAEQSRDLRQAILDLALTEGRGALAGAARVAATSRQPWPHWGRQRFSGACYFSRGAGLERGSET